MTKQAIIPLYEITVSIDPTGVVTRLTKTPVTFTGKNYIPQRMTAELEAQGYDYIGLGSRVPSENVMKVQRSGRFDNTDNVRYEIYFLEGQKDAAVLAIRSFLDKKIEEMKQQMDAMHDAWKTRKERPKKSA